MTSNDIPLQLAAGKQIIGSKFTYLIKGIIDRGGSGVVYRASCGQIYNDVAIKFSYPCTSLNLDN